jgi:hypothetical protein
MLATFILRYTNTARSSSSKMNIQVISLKPERLFGKMAAHVIPFKGNKKSISTHIKIMITKLVNKTKQKKETES